MKYVLLYESAPDGLSKVPLHFADHTARYEEFHERGTLLMIGIFGDPQTEGAMGIFSTRESAEEFAAGDPFVVNGVVAKWSVREWHEVLTEP